MAGITNPIVSTAEVQTITVDATGGTFTVTWNGATTSALAFNVSAASFTTAMDAIADGTGNVVVTGGPGAAGGGTPYTLTWSAGRGNVPAPTTDATSLTGGAGTAVVATTTAGVTALADPWLSVGAHAEPTTSVVPDQGDWQWCMTEVAAWMGGSTWSDEPANVSPVIAAVCNSLNDLLHDNERQNLKTRLEVAPDGIIDTVDGTKETTREWMCADWLVRTLLPMWLDYIDDADVAAASADIAALPALAAGTFDEAATLAALEVAGRAVWAWQATREISSFEAYGGGGPGWAALSLPALYELYGSDFIDRGLGAHRGWAGLASTGDDDGHLAVREATAAGRQAVWDTVLAYVPAALFTGRSDDYAFRRGGDYVPGSAFMLLRDVIWALCTNAVSSAVGGAVLGSLSGFDEFYVASQLSATTTLETLGVGDDTTTAALALIDDLCAV